MKSYVVLLFLTACAGNHPEFELYGLPVERAQVESVRDYVETNGAPLLGGRLGAGYLRAVERVTFVPAVFECPAGQCFGITYVDGRAAESTVALVQADYTEAPTSNVGCTALAHELAHTLSWQVTGDADGRHTNPALWGPNGVVVASLRYFCPGWHYTPNNYNP